ncbi:hypothetical protein CQW23_25721 [Capsicum baccatum]|uniref:F-box/kelch-repeat protein SKIP11 n=1 Tax=Capsicum baccatum TaxID=33114 RepID=A0A2G2VLP6_CAPBA|nr:hypothetical protein CQW23_25721 [Capsicum baccatum]
MIQSASRSAPSIFFGSITNKKALKEDMLLSPNLMLIPAVRSSSASPDENDDNQDHVGDNSDWSTLFPAIDRGNSINTFICCSGAATKRCGGALVYLSYQEPEWEALDPARRHWMHQPRMTPNDCFVLFSEKESLGIASLGELAIFSGGCYSQGKILRSAELYNSETGTWRTLRSMNKQRKMCSGVFIVGKFYVIGVIRGADSKLLTSSPVVAVVSNQLSTADYAEMSVRKYEKHNKA